MKGERNKSFIHRGLGRGEVLGGLLWLSLGALISVMLEVIYLGTWITLPGGALIPFPYTILVAFLFNIVLTRTSMLWTDSRAVAATPLLVWVAGFMALSLWTLSSGDQLVPSTMRSILLLCAGVSGGIWPLLKTA
ncbi:hypothetical protein [Corynebacterium pacaense]|uniref:hypothetical protein n=1 Tax=Corynebacterium pacaense TaxID=1816684 RepID=UPI0009BA0040|nr:hypothetical protein [Corynebacterium pacaense]